MCKFSVGQEVVCIEKGSEREGKVFVVESIMKSPCGCYSLNIGAQLNLLYDGLRCHKHKVDISNRDGIHWMAEEFFAPIQRKRATASELITQFNVIEKPDLVKTKEVEEIKTSSAKV